MREFIENSITFGIVLSILGYELGLFLRKKFNSPIVNPLLIAMVSIICFLLLTGIDYKSYAKGAGYIGYLLTPATVSLAIPLYKNIEVLKKNYMAIVSGIVAGIIANMLIIFLAALLFKLSSKEYITIMPKSITSAIGMVVSEEYGGIAAITVALIVITGIIGNIIAVPICRSFKIKSPVAKGVAIGTSAHAMGVTKAMELGEIEGSIAGLAMAVCGILTLIAVPIFAGLI